MLPDFILRRVISMAEQFAETMQSPLRITPVVTCFLMRTDAPQPLLALVRRSQRVGSYHAHWAGISGFIEAGVSPEEQAYTEILEETGLQHDQVRFLKRGQVVEHQDVALNRHWLVHPFLVEVLDPDAMKLDWEASEMRWIDPADLASFETVPKLQEAYQAALAGDDIL
jgi:ADP-ribose pyrophosphatase YjhB (NUDIX family)